MSGALAVLCAAAALAAPPPAPGTARVSGIVTAEARVQAKEEADEVYGDRAGAYAPLFDYRHLKDVVVYAEPVSTAAAVAPADAPPARLTFRPGRNGTAVEPAFLALRVGGELLLRNETGQDVGVVAGGRSAASLMVRVSSNSSTAVRLRESGPYWLMSPEAPGRSALVFAAGPYFAVADAAGRYALELPPGDYVVTAWHPRLPPRSSALRIEAGKEPRLDFMLSVKGLPEVP